MEFFGRLDKNQQEVFLWSGQTMCELLANSNLDPAVKEYLKNYLDKKTPEVPTSKWGHRGGDLRGISTLYKLTFAQRDHRFSSIRDGISQEQHRQVGPEIFPSLEYPLRF